MNWTASIMIPTNSSPLRNVEQDSSYYKGLTYSLYWTFCWKTDSLYLSRLDYKQIPYNGYVLGGTVEPPSDQSIEVIVSPSDLYDVFEI